MKTGKIVSNTYFTNVRHSHSKAWEIENFTAVKWSIMTKMSKIDMTL